MAEQVRYWRHPAVADVDLVVARYRRHEFTRHSHEAFAIGLNEINGERLGIRGDNEVVRPGGLILINPGQVHTGQPAAPGEWGYRAIYPSPALVGAVARELSTGATEFRRSVVYDDLCANAIRVAHRAAERGDRLAASSALHAALGLLLTRHGDRRPRPVRAAGRRDVALARAMLHERMTAPPTLDELAEHAGTGKFALLRAFHAELGLPPFAYLNQLRVRRVRELLAAGTPLAVAAAETGFVDQAHMSRHFRRIVGMPPGVYRAQTGGVAYRNHVQESPTGRVLPSRDDGIPTGARCCVDS
ncbi:MULTISPECIES: AraC family transcriptional regulator [unclassified Nocardia]|uniref:AraC family transcriptional regulator n=1 Tax=unclassified Nocardia TaxID=2637762 RepID=UPI001CE4B1E9|nr:MULTISPECIES: AraC family transcriptional regulator [unclassified Nocardia]